jgi:hypothetical protein
MMKNKNLKNGILILFFLNQCWLLTATFISYLSIHQIKIVALELDQALMMIGHLEVETQTHLIVIAQHLELVQVFLRQIIFHAWE